MKVGINCLGFVENKSCGAEEVLLNLVRGFRKFQYENELVFFCYPLMKQKIERLIERAEYIVFPCAKKAYRHELFYVTKVQSRLFHKIYKQFKLDVIAFMNIGVGIRKYNVPIMVIPHDIQNVSNPDSKKLWYIKYLVYKIFYQINFRITDSIVAISEMDKEEITYFYPQYAQKIIRIYNPIHIKENIKIDENKDKTIMAVNIQYPHKNIFTLINAFQILLEKGYKYQLLLIGRETEFVESLKKYVLKRKLEKNIDFLGYIEREKLVQLWSKTSLYVNPSKFEGFGMTSAESLILGAPTLLGDLSVNREITENACSYYQKIEDENKLADSMIQILDCKYNLNNYQQISKIMRDKYSIDRISCEYWKELSKLCTMKGL